MIPTTNLFIVEEQRGQAQIDNAVMSYIRTELENAKMLWEQEKGPLT